MYLLLYSPRIDGVITSIPAPGPHRHNNPPRHLCTFRPSPQRCSYSCTLFIFASFSFLHLQNNVSSPLPQHFPTNSSPPLAFSMSLWAPSTATTNASSPSTRPLSTLLSMALSPHP